MSNCYLAEIPGGPETELIHNLTCSSSHNEISCCYVATVNMRAARRPLVFEQSI